MQMDIKLAGIDPNMIANNLTTSRPIHPGEMIRMKLSIVVYLRRIWLLRSVFLPRCLMLSLTGKEPLRLNTRFFLKLPLVLRLIYG